jgi:hypothetical protein
MEDEKNVNELTVWGAVGPNGHVVKSSIGIFKAVANRWALKRGNYEVVKLGTIKAPALDDTPKNKTTRNRDVRGPTTRKRGRPRKEDTAQKAG